MPNKIEISKDRYRIYKDVVYMRAKKWLTFATIICTIATVEPVADRRIVNCLTDAAEGITMLFQTLFAGAVLFLLMFAVLIRATS